MESSIERLSDLARSSKANIPRIVLLSSLQGGGGYDKGRIP